MKHVVVMLLLLVAHVACAQGAAGTGATAELRYLVDVPTAGMIARGSLALDTDFYQEGGVLFGVSIGLLDRLSLGIAYGGSRLIGSQEPVMNKAPGINVKIRIIEEGESAPAIALGFDSQGRDGFVKNLDRYLIKSPGFYAVASRNYSLAGNFSIHGGINYSLERADNDGDVNFFVGAEKSIGSVVSFLLEYNLGTNDSHGNALGKGRGYLNAGLRWSVGGGLTLGFNLKDIIKNGRDITVGNRTVRLEYTQSL